MSKNTIIGSIIGLIVIATVGFFLMNNSNQSGSEVQGESDTNQTIQTVSTPHFEQIIQENENNEDFELIDLRTPEEFESGYIEGAKLMNFYDPDFSSSLNDLDKTKTYAIYCNSGNRSGAALGLMESKGFEKVYNLDGGIQAWASEGYELI